MKDLIESLQIFFKYCGDIDYPTHCEHDILLVRVDRDVVIDEDSARLEKLGWHWSSEYDSWASFRFGSA